MPIQAISLKKKSFDTKERNKFELIITDKRKIIARKKTKDNAINKFNIKLKPLMRSIDISQLLPSSSSFGKSIIPHSPTVLSPFNKSPCENTPTANSPIPPTPLKIDAHTSTFLN